MFFFFLNLRENQFGVWSSFKYW